MFTNNCFGLALSSSIYLYSVVTYGDDTHTRVLSDPTLFINCFMLGLGGCFGQVFIFLTISLFDSYHYTVISTTRKFFTVLLSNFYFGHNFTSLQWLGAAIVLCCTSLELCKKRKKKMTEKEGENKVKSN